MKFACICRHWSRASKGRLVNLAWSHHFLLMSAYLDVQPLSLMLRPLLWLPWVKWSLPLNPQLHVLNITIPLLRPSVVVEVTGLPRLAGSATTAPSCSVSVAMSTHLALWRRRWAFHSRNSLRDMQGESGVSPCHYAINEIDRHTAQGGVWGTSLALSHKRGTSHLVGNVHHQLLLNYMTHLNFQIMTSKLICVWLWADSWHILHSSSLMLGLV